MPCFRALATRQHTTQTTQHKHGRSTKQKTHTQRRRDRTTAAATDAPRHATERPTRKRRRKTTLTSALEGIPGVGAARRKALLKHLGSVRAVVEADLEALMGVPGVGPQMAETIYLALHPNE